MVVRSIASGIENHFLGFESKFSPIECVAYVDLIVFKGALLPLGVRQEVIGLARENTSILKALERWGWSVDSRANESLYFSNRVILR